jgi:hypothetical protein
MKFFDDGFQENKKDRKLKDVQHPIIFTPFTRKLNIVKVIWQVFWLKPNLIAFPYLFTGKVALLIIFQSPLLGLGFLQLRG